jgi:allophanate hydrolase subunit 2
LVIVHALGLVTVQDLGRPGRMHEAIPPGGALVPELLVAANRRALNPDGAPAVEVLGRLVVRAARDATVATDEHARRLRAGDELAVESGPRRVAYLAVRGGVDAPTVLGGRGALLCAGLGAPLRAGDAIRAGNEPESEPFDYEPFDDGDRIGVIPGPDLDAFSPGAIDRLTSSTYRISPGSDRIGTRLFGEALPPLRTGASRPMVRGAIEVPGDGQPIVLGPEHPTTGGYPILAVVAHGDLGRFFAIRLGGSVRFVV